MSFIVKDNWVDGATITADNEQTGKPAARLAAERVFERYRADRLSVNGTTITIDIVPAAPQPTRVLFLQRPRLSRKLEKIPANNVFDETDTIQHILYDDAPGGNVIYDSAAAFGGVPQPSGMVPGLGSHGVWLPQEFPAVAAWRIVLNAASRAAAPDDHTDLGRAVAGPAVIFDVAYKKLVAGTRSNSNSRRPKAGVSLYPRKAPMWRQWSVLFKSILNESRPAMEDFLLEVNDLSQFLIGLEETDPARSWMLAAMQNQDLDKYSPGWSQLPMPVQEAL